MLTPKPPTALLGIAAGTVYSTRDRPQKVFDAANHKVIPRDPKIPTLPRGRGIRQIIQTCSHMVKVLRRA